MRSSTQHGVLLWAVDPAGRVLDRRPLAGVTSAWSFGEDGRFHEPRSGLPRWVAPVAGGVVAAGIAVAAGMAIQKRRG